MKMLNNNTLSAIALTVLVAALNIAPANAGGRSGAHASMDEARTQAAGQQGQVEIRLQAQIDALRKDLAELKAQQAPAKAASAMQ